MLRVTTCYRLDCFGALRLAMTRADCPPVRLTTYPIGMSDGELRARFKTRASTILASLVATRGPLTREKHREQWSLMWDLLREARATGQPFEFPTPARWEYQAFEVDDVYGVIRWLTSGVQAQPFELLISYPPDHPEENFLATELPKFLNWADVPVPVGAKS